MNEGDELFYDGGCGLCHSAVRFVLNRGEKGRVFRFAPLGGETFRQQLSVGHRAGLPDSMVILTASGAVLTRSRAVLHVLRTLDGGWRLLGRLGQVLPRFLADALYDFLASIRHRLFKKPGDVCPRLSDEERTRFDA